MHIKHHMAMEGFYTMVRRNGDTGEEVSRHEFPNIITDIGLDRWGYSTPINGVMVGSGNATPTTADTTLQAQVAYTGTQEGNSVAVPGTGTGPNYYSSHTRTYRFPQGAAAGNLSEVGAGWNAGGALGHRVFSRALIRDADGNPTTITVLPNEILDVTYTVRMYHMQGEVVVNNVMLLGKAYTVRIKASQAATNYASAIFNSSAPNDLLYNATFYAGEWGATVEGQPSTSGGSAQTSFSDRNPYVANSMKTSVVFGLNLNAGNFATGVRSMQSLTTYGPTFQFQFEPRIMKTNAMQFKITVEVSWGRYSGTP